MRVLFKTEEDAIKWVGMNIALAIKPKKKAKTKLIYPFSSFHSHNEVINHLGKDLFNYQQEQLKKKQ